MKEKIDHFNFYRNYYDIIKYLKTEDKLIITNAILEYMFDDKEPRLEGLNLGIWNNIKMPLNTTKTNIINGKKGGRPKTETKSKQKPKIKPNSKPKVKANNISLFSFLISNFYYLDKELLKKKIEEWLIYKEERKEIYKETGMKSLLKQMENNCKEYGDEKVIALIDECMANNWKGIIWEKLKDKPKKENLPDWWNLTNKDFEGGLTDEERREFETIKNGTYKA